MYKETLEMDVPILSINIGTYTQDMLLWNGSYETSFKLILPSPTIILGEKVKEYTVKQKDLVITGETMGGGPFTQAIFNHLKEGLEVYMTPNAAYTIRDDLNYVENKGIKIVDDEEAAKLSNKKNVNTMETSDMDAEALYETAKRFGITLKPKVVAVGVEDHGTSHNDKTNREIRFDHFKSLIPAHINDFGFLEPPKHYTRMLGVKNKLNRYFHKAEHLIMDSKIAAMFGASLGADKEKVITVDVGSGHTIVASFEYGEITGLFEHHTNMLTRMKLRDILAEFAAGDLTNSKVFNDGGHGCYIARPIGTADIIVSGPKVASLFEKNSPGIRPSSIDDKMIPGNVGLIECSKSMFKL
ncbi:MAG: DUF1786 family protein [Candidatus Thermoplasmatota archaeon]|nr:DUF1786 family protein [Candidatus Thermoplasmatota archaeon]MDP7265934.1 DUF1786 family protein [Candidatus Thermoplasmatota archaeon]